MPLLRFVRTGESHAMLAAGREHAASHVDASLAHRRGCATAARSEREAATEVSALIDRTGQRYGRLTVVALAGRASNRDALWLCRCDCGCSVEISASNLRTGHSRSCGCLMRATAVALGRRYGGANVTHGHARRGRTSPEYTAYIKAKQRCTNPNTEGFEHWGGRGIEFRYSSFAEFLADVGPRPSPTLTLDRIDNNGHYEPGNCRWATRSVQNANQRPRRCVRH